MTLQHVVTYRVPTLRFMHIPPIFIMKSTLMHNSKIKLMWDMINVEVVGIGCSRSLVSRGGGGGIIF